MEDTSSGEGQMHGVTGRRPLLRALSGHHRGCGDWDDFLVNTDVWRNCGKYDAVTPVITVTAVFVVTVAPVTMTAVAVCTVHKPTVVIMLAGQATQRQASNKLQSAVAPRRV